MLSCRASQQSGPHAPRTPVLAHAYTPGLRFLTPQHYFSVPSCGALRDLIFFPWQSMEIRALTPWNQIPPFLREMGIWILHYSPDPGNELHLHLHHHHWGLGPCPLLHLL